MGKIVINPSGKRLKIVYPEHIQKLLDQLTKQMIICRDIIVISHGYRTCDDETTYSNDLANALNNDHTLHYIRKQIVKLTEVAIPESYVLEDYTDGKNNN